MEYNNWARKFHPLSVLDRKMIKEHIRELKVNPKISVVMPVFNTIENWLRKSIESVLSQLYGNWELCICNNGSKPYVCDILREYVSKDSRIKVITLAENIGGAQGTNKAIELTTGDYIAFLDSDDELVDDSLYYIAVSVNEHKHIKFIYSDNSIIDGNGDITDVYYKPDWSPDLFYSQCYPSDLAVFEASLLKSLMLQESNGSHDYDLLLRSLEIISPKEIYHIPEVLYKYRAHSMSLTVQDESKAIFGAMTALQNHLDRMQARARVFMDYPWYRVKYDLPNPAPSVAIIIVSVNKDGLLFECINKLLSRTDYPNFKFYLCIPDQIKDFCISYRRQLVTREIIKFVQRGDNEAFSYSKFANRSVECASEDVVCLLNDDIEPISDSWLTELVSHAIRPKIGVVGTKLVYPNLTLQHAGAVTGIGGTAAHVFKHQAYGAEGYWGRARLIGNFSVVTGACSVIKRERYLEVGGYPEELRVAYNDVDFCLKLIQKGYYNLYTPYAPMIHKESATRGYDTTPEQQTVLKFETEWLKNKWGSTLTNDPFYNPHLSLEDWNFAVTEKSRAIKPWLK